MGPFSCGACLSALELFYFKLWAADRPIRSAKLPQQRRKPRFELSQRREVAIRLSAVSAREVALGTTKRLTALCLGYALASGTYNLDSSVSNVFSSFRVAAKEYAKSPGSFVKLLANAASVRLPSGASVRMVEFASASAVTSRSPLVDYPNRKSSKFFFKQSKISVRGAAKNAVDHRNGGKGPGGIRKYV